MTRFTITLAAAALGLAAASVAANAGSYAAGCTKEPSSAWKAVDTSASKAATMGYQVSKTKISGTCHEIYAMKDGRKVEMFFNPVTNDLVHTQAK